MRHLSSALPVVGVSLLGIVAAVGLLAVAYLAGGRSVLGY